MERSQALEQLALPLYVVAMADYPANFQILNCALPPWRHVVSIMPIFVGPPVLVVAVATAPRHGLCVQLWLLCPDSSRFVTSPRPGYANRPNGQLTVRGLSHLKICSLVGCSPAHRFVPLSHEAPAGSFIQGWRSLNGCNTRKAAGCRCSC